MTEQILKIIKKVGSNLKDLTLEVKIPTSENTQSYIDHLREIINGPDSQYELRDVLSSQSNSQIYHFHIRKKNGGSSNA